VKLSKRFKNKLLKLKEIRDSTRKYLVELLKVMQERENVKKLFTELLQLEFEAEVNSIMKNDKTGIDKKIKDYLDKCQFTKYKPTNKPSNKNIQISNDENIPVSDQNIPKGYQANASRIKHGDSIAMKDISNLQSIKLKNVVTNIPNGQVNAPARAAATVRNFNKYNFSKLKIFFYV